MQVLFKDDHSNSELKFEQMPEADLPLLALCEAQVLGLLEPPREINCFGKKFMPRLQVFLSDVEGLVYTFSKTTFVASGLTAELRALLALVNARCGADFNSILVNHYRNGRDHISAHADDEAGVDPVAGVVTVSCGATRTFVLRRSRPPKEIVIRLQMPHGSMIAMSGSDFQKSFLHAVTPTAKETQPRTSFTFRKVSV